MLLTALSFPRTAIEHWAILRSFVWRELSARYTGSLIGRLWPVLYPVVLFTIYHFVFAGILELRFGSAGAAIGEGWVATFYLLSGILPWIFFAESLARSCNVVIENANLITKVAFPTELLPTYVVLVNLVHFSIAATLLILLYATICLLGVGTPDGASAGLPVIAHLLWLPLVVALQTVLTVGLAMVLCTLTVFLRDVKEVVPLVLLLWMFVTPVFYDVSMVEKAGGSFGLALMKLNPIYHLLALYRACFRADPSEAFPLDSLAIIAALALAAFALGHATIARCKGTFADEV